MTIHIKGRIKGQVPSSTWPTALTPSDRSSLSTLSLPRPPHLLHHIHFPYPPPFLIFLVLLFFLDRGVGKRFLFWGLRDIFLKLTPWWIDLVVACTVTNWRWLFTHRFSIWHLFTYKRRRYSKNLFDRSFYRSDNWLEKWKWKRNERKGLTGLVDDSIEVTGFASWQQQRWWNNSSPS